MRSSLSKSGEYFSCGQCLNTAIEESGTWGSCSRLERSQRNGLKLRSASIVFHPAHALVRLLSRAASLGRPLHGGSGDSEERKLIPDSRGWVSPRPRLRDRVFLNSGLGRKITMKTIGIALLILAFGLFAFADEDVVTAIHGTVTKIDK